MPRYFLLSSARVSKPGLDLDYAGRYQQGDATASLLDTTVDAGNIETMIAQIGNLIDPPAFVFDRFLSIFRTEFNARAYLAAALSASNQPVHIVELLDSGWQSRLARMARLLDLDVREEHRDASLVHYSVRERPAANGFGAVRLEQQTAILSDACGVRDPALMSPAEICGLVETHMRDQTPFSFVRFNHCEPRVGGLHYLFNLSDANDTARLQWGRDDLDTEAIAPIAAGLLAAARSADLLGIPSVAPLHKSKLSLLENSCYVLFRDLGLLRPAHRVTLVNTHLQLGTSPHFYALLRDARRLSLISGRDVVAGLGEKVGRTDIDWIRIPVEHSHANGDRTGRHFPDAFREIGAHLRDTVRPGHVVLVGGGILGKIYCDQVKAAGGIALDLGSLFDAWAGKVTRGFGFQDALRLA